MEITVDVASVEHPYQQIARQLRAKIAAGEYADGRLPSLTQLMDKTTPRPGYNTVRHAIRVLVDEGLVTAAPGRGTFVRKDGGR